MKTLQNLKSRALALFAMLVCSAAMSAADYTPLKMNETFVLKNFGMETWVITPEESGVMTITGASADDYFGPCLDVYPSVESIGQEGGNIALFTYGPSRYELSVEAGHAYYIVNNNWSGMDIKAKCSMGSAFEFVSVSPADGTPFYIIGDNEAYFTFTSSNVGFTEGELSCNGNVVKIYNFNDYEELVRNGTFSYSESGASGMTNYNGAVLGRSDSGIVIPFITQTGYAQINVIYDMLSTGKIAPGQTMTLTLHGVSNLLSGELLNGNGELTVNWLVPEMPTILVKSTLPETFYSYWNKGDESGIAVFEFSRDIRSAKAMIAMGDAEASDRYESPSGTIPVTVDGRFVKVDFTGVTRTPASMGLQTAYPQMEFTLYNVVDADGNAAYAEGQGKASSYDFVMAYKNNTGTVSYEFTPGSGSLKDVKEIELWYMDVNGLIETDGVEVSYYTVGQDNALVKYSKLLKMEELSVFVAPDGTVVTIPVTEEMQNAVNVCVRLHVTKSYDGREHNIAAYYNQTTDPDNPVVGIKALNAGSASGNVYTVGGVKTQAKRSGIYVVNGKKYIVK